MSNETFKVLNKHSAPGELFAEIAVAAHKFGINLDVTEVHLGEPLMLEIGARKDGTNLMLVESYMSPEPNVWSLYECSQGFVVSELFSM